MARVLEVVAGIWTGMFRGTAVRRAKAMGTVDWLLPVGMIERPEKGILSEPKNPCFDVVTGKPPASTTATVAAHRSVESWWRRSRYLERCWDWPPPWPE